MKISRERYRSAEGEKTSGIEHSISPNLQDLRSRSIQTSSLLATAAYIEMAMSIAATEKITIQRCQVRPGLVLLLAFLHGLLYLAIVPPWQNFDETGHFEYVRSMALNHKGEQHAEADLLTRREIADSMYRFRFWSDGIRPDLFSPQAPQVGISQRVHPPLYYMLAAVPVRWTQYLSIETQLYAARLVSLGFYMLTVLTAWQLGRLVAPDQPLLQTTVLLLLIMTPAFANMMTAVNNDVLVNFSMACVLLGCVHLIRDGLRPLSLTLVVLSLTVAIGSKRTAVVAIVPVALSLLWALRRQPIRWYAWVTVGSLVLVMAGCGAFEYAPAKGSEGTWHLFQARPWLVELDQAYLRLQVNYTIQSLSDWERSRQVYPGLINILFTSFWMHFGWGHVRMGAGWEHAMLGVVGIASVGLVRQFVWGRQPLALAQQRWIWLAVVMVVAAWLSAMIRVHPLSPPGTWMYIPRGRYMHLALLPTLWLLVLGYNGFVPQRWRRYSLSALVLFFVLLDLVAWAVTLMNFYYRS